MTCLIGGAAVLSVSLLAGGCGDAYRNSADRDVYRILEDRKQQALGYDPQTVSEPVIKPSPGLAGQNQPTIDAVEGAPPQGDEKPGPVPSRAYSRIPTTPLPPMAAPALDITPEVAQWGPLGPFIDEIDDGSNVKMDPFAVDMASRWSERRLRYGPVAPRNKPIELDLFESLRYAVRHSRSYRNQMDDLYLAALDVTLERHLLSPRPFVGGSLLYSGGQNDANYNSALTATMNAGVRQRLPYGGEIVAQTLVSFVNALDGNVDDGENASLVLSGSVPLLRGAGMVNLEALISSERDVVYQVRTFEEFRRVFVISVSDAYFRLLASYQSVNNRRTNLKNSQSLLDRTRAIYAANLGGGGAVAGGRTLRLTFLEVQRSEQQLLDAQNSLIDAQEAYLNDLDDFKLLLGMDVRQDVDIIPVALEVNIPELEGYDLIEVANRFRLDLQTARDRIDDARRRVANAENGLLPDLSVVARGEIGNRDNTPGRDIDSRTLRYSGGLNLDLPVDRVAERNVYRRALVSFHQAQRQFEDLADRVAADVRSAARAIQSSRVALAIQKRSTELAQRRLDNANLLLKRGETNARDVVEAQQALIRAQDAFERARADLQVQVLQFLRQTGTLRVDPETGALGRALDRRRPDLSTARTSNTKP